MKEDLRDRTRVASVSAGDFVFTGNSEIEIEIQLTAADAKLCSSRFTDSDR